MTPKRPSGYGIADNRLGDLSTWDYDILAQISGGIDPDAELETGFAEGELEEILQAAGIAIGEGAGRNGRRRATPG